MNACAHAIYDTKPVLLRTGASNFVNGLAIVSFAARHFSGRELNGTHALLFAPEPEGPVSSENQANLRHPVSPGVLLPEIRETVVTRQLDHPQAAS